MSTYSMNWRFADLTGYLSYMYTFNIPTCLTVCTSRSDGYMDVNVVMLLKNVRNWLYFDQSMGKWGENFVLDCCTVAVREGWNWDTTSLLQVTCSFVLRILLRSELVN